MVGPAFGPATGGGLRTRVLSALVLAPLVIGITYWGGAAFNLMIAAVALLMAYEWKNLCAAAARPQWTGWMALGAVYIAVPMIAVVWLRAEPAGGPATVLWLLAVIWGTDTGAYFAGRAIGGPKLAPRISPKKTWAGLAGGMITAGLVGAGTAAFMGLPDGLGLVVFSMVLAVVAQGGDLLESAVKRHFKVKDSGAVIPGHGGLLDRLDGLMTAAPTVAAVVWLSGGGVLA